MGPKFGISTSRHVPANKDPSTNVMLARQNERREYMVKSICVTSGNSTKSRKAETSFYKRCDRRIYPTLFVRYTFFVSRSLDLMYARFFGRGGWFYYVFGFRFCARKYISRGPHSCGSICAGQANLLKHSMISSTRSE